MRIAIMQPYFLPYIGYFQLLNAVDKFVVLDDVNFIKGGWINRNQILHDGRRKWITVPLTKSSPNLHIADITTHDGAPWRVLITRQCESAYKTAPYYRQGMHFLAHVLQFADHRISQYLYKTLVYIAHLLEIRAEIVPTSTIYPKNGHCGEQRILDICVAESASVYINLPGGRQLYNPDNFAARAVNLQFLSPSIMPYFQGKADFEPSLSVLDLLMWMDLDEVRHHVRSGLLER